MSENTESILEEAQRLVHGDRGAAYGHPSDDYQTTVDMWRAMIRRRYGIDVPLTPDFGCLMMVVVKLSREAGKPKRDNLVDAAGYAECAAMCIERATPVEATLDTPTPRIFAAVAEPGPIVHLEPLHVPVLEEGHDG